MILLIITYLHPPLVFVPPPDSLLGQLRIRLVFCLHAEFIHKFDPVPEQLRLFDGGQFPP